MNEQIFDLERDWEYLKEELLSELPEEQREFMLEWVILQAIFN